MRYVLLLARPISLLGSRGHHSKGNFQAGSHKMCRNEHRQMKHLLNLSKFLHIIIIQYGFCFTIQKIGINSKNNTFFIKKLGCNFSRGQLGTMHIFMVSLGCQSGTGLVLL